MQHKQRIYKNHFSFAKCDQYAVNKTDKQNGLNKQLCAFPREYNDSRMQNIDNIGKNISQLLSLVKNKDTKIEENNKYDNKLNDINICKNEKNSKNQQSWGFIQYRRRILKLQQIQEIGQNIEKQKILIQMNKNDSLNYGKNCVNLIKTHEVCDMENPSSHNLLPIQTSSKQCINTGLLVHAHRRTPIIFSEPNLKYINRSTNSAKISMQKKKKQRSYQSNQKQKNNPRKTQQNTSARSSPHTNRSHLSRYLNTNNFQCISQESLDLSNLKYSQQTNNYQRNDLKIQIDDKQNLDYQRLTPKKVSRFDVRDEPTPKEHKQQSIFQIKIQQNSQHQQISPYRSHFEIKVYPCNLNKDNIKQFIADRLSLVVKIDIQFQQMKNMFWQFQQNLSVRQKKRRLLQVLGNRGINVVQQQIQNILGLTHTKKQQKTSKSQNNYRNFNDFAQDFIDKYLQSEYQWQKKVLSMLTKQQIDICLFKPSVLDLQNKGYLKIQDVACFINLNASQSVCYKNKQVQKLFQRFTRYQDIQSKLTYAMFLKIISERIY